MENVVYNVRTWRSVYNVRTWHSGSKVVTRDREGVATFSGSEAGQLAFGNFVYGLAQSRFSLFDETAGKWIVGTAEQLAQEPITNLQQAIDAIQNGKPNG